MNIDKEATKRARQKQQSGIDRLNEIYSWTEQAGEQAAFLKRTSSPPGRRLRRKTGKARRAARRLNRA